MLLWHAPVVVVMVLAQVGFGAPSILAAGLLDTKRTQNGTAMVLGLLARRLHQRRICREARIRSKGLHHP